MPCHPQGPGSAAPSRRSIMSSKVSGRVGMIELSAPPPPAPGDRRGGAARRGGEGQAAARPGQARHSLEGDSAHTGQPFQGTAYTSDWLVASTAHSCCCAVLCRRQGPRTWGLKATHSPSGRRRATAAHRRDNKWSHVCRRYIRTSIGATGLGGRLMAPHGAATRKLGPGVAGATGNRRQPHRGTAAHLSAFAVGAHPRPEPPKPHAA